MESLRPHYSRPSLAQYSGVTLIEMLVVLGIIMILATVVITAQSSFNKSFILTNTAYDVALSIRSAETFGLGGRGVSSTIKNVGYGMHFIKGNTYFLFADTYPTSASCHTAYSSATSGFTNAPDTIKGNCAYNSGNDQLVTGANYVMGNGITISNACVYTTTDATHIKATCSVASATTVVNGITYTHVGGLTSLDVVFSRPNVKTFYALNGTYQSTYNNACLTISSPQGTTKSIYINPTGEVEVSSSACL